jgi:hypothetical protein
MFCWIRKIAYNLRRRKVNNYNKLIEIAALRTGLKFSVAKALVELASNYNPFLYEVDNKAWPQVIKYKEEFKRLFLSHFINSLGTAKSILCLLWIN